MESWYPKPTSFDHVYREAGARPRGVYRSGVDITDTVRPSEWPEPDRTFFFTLGWRPYTPPGTAPLWHEHADGQIEETAPPGELAFQQRINIGLLVAEAVRVKRARR